MSARILVVDDDAAVRFTLRAMLEDEGLGVVEASDGRSALAEIDGPEPVHLVITDLRMPGMDGMTLLRELSPRPGAPRAILLTAHGDERAAVEAMKAGAWDYFKKPFEIEALLAVVRRAVDTLRLVEDNARLQGTLHLSRSVVFASTAMGRLATLIQRLGPRDVTVLITGESGTGKERVADAVVQASGRAGAPFVRFNCASLGAELAEAELFGHSRGAFTGAVRARPGLFREADGGSILLDEVGELAPAVQARLLRVLQSGEVRPVGEDRPVKVDVRVIAATHRDLAQMVASGEFREDLYYRLKVVHLAVPPLRERPEDIPALARHFLEIFSARFGTGPLRLPPELVPRLAALPWPGNVRELENTIEMLVALSAGGEVDLSLLPDGGGVASTRALGLKDRMEAYERGILVETLRSTGGNKAEAARVLGIGRVTLYEKLGRLGLD